jgi:predicted alpha/beta-fold hydrolase
MSFDPPFLLKNGHVQTLVGALPMHLRREAPATHWRRIPLAEGGALLAKVWWQPGDTPRPLVVVIHGLGGSSEGGYVRRLARTLYGEGYHVARLNQRGAGDSLPLAPSLYHAGLTRDVDTAARHFAHDARVASLAFVGFSLGGNLVLKAAAEWGAAPPPKVASVVSISAPMDLAATSRHLETPITTPYRLFVLQALLTNARSFAARNPGRVAFDPRRLKRFGTLRDYDAQVVVPMHGFASVDAYYGVASSGSTLARIRVPTLVIHAEDDPMVPGWSVRPSLEGRSEAVSVAWSERGGHVSWIGGSHEAGWARTWAFEQALPFLARTTTEHKPIALRA